MRREGPRLVTPVFLLVVASATLYFISVGMLYPVLPRYVTDRLHGGSVAVGLANGSFSFAAVALRPLVGRLSDARGRRVMVVAGAAIAAACTGAYHFAGSLFVLVLLRVVTGVGEALYFTGAAATVNDLAPDARRGEAVSYFSIALYTGLAFGPFVGEAVLRQTHFGSVWTIAALGSLAAAVIALPLPETRSGEVSTSRAWINRAAILPGWVMMVSVWAFAGFTAFLPLYALQLGMPGSRNVFLVFAGTILLVRAFGARIPDALGAVRTVTISLIASAAGLLIVSAWESRAGLFAGAIVFAAGQSLAFPALMSLAVRRAPSSERGAVVGTFTAFVDLGFGLGPVTLGVVASYAGYRGAFLAGAVVAASGIAILFSDRNKGEAPA